MCSHQHRIEINQKSDSMLATAPLKLMSSRIPTSPSIRHPGKFTRQF